MQINEISGVSRYLSHDKQDMKEEMLSSPQNQALVELEEASGDVAISETLEELSMALGGRIKERDRSDSLMQRKRQLLMDMMASLEEGGEVSGLLSSIQENADITNNVGRQIFASLVLLSNKKLSENKRRELTSLLDELMENAGWEVDLFGLIEMGKIDKPAFSAIKKLFSQAMDEESVSLSQWFERIAGWPDRRQRVRVLLRALAFELTACVDGDQKNRLATVLARLRRLLVFLGLEKECATTERLCDLGSNSLLPLLIEMTNQSWVFSDWLMDKMRKLTTQARCQKRLLHILNNLFVLMPDACFHDDDHRTQILEVIGEAREDKASP